MSTDAGTNYKELYERMEKAMDEATSCLLNAHAECQVLLEESGERKRTFSKISEEHLDALVLSLRLEQEMTDDADYKKMYLTLFNAVTGAIQQIDWQNYGRAKDLLITAQQNAEEIFISSGEP